VPSRTSISCLYIGGMKLHMSTLQLTLAATFLLVNEVVVADYLAVNCGGQTYPDGGIPQ
jgi:hypothetical protein